MKGKLLVKLWMSAVLTAASVTSAAAATMIYEISFVGTYATTYGSGTMTFDDTQRGVGPHNLPQYLFLSVSGSGGSKGNWTGAFFEYSPSGSFSEWAIYFSTTGSTSPGFTFEPNIPSGLAPMDAFERNLAAAAQLGMLHWSHPIWYGGVPDGGGTLALMMLSTALVAVVGRKVCGVG